MRRDPMTGSCDITIHPRTARRTIRNTNEPAMGDECPPNVMTITYRDAVTFHAEGQPGPLLNLVQNWEFLWTRLRP